MQNTPIYIHPETNPMRQEFLMMSMKMPIIWRILKMRRIDLSDRAERVFLQDL